jgi:Flp pilus assembly protein TadG
VPLTWRPARGRGRQPGQAALEFALVLLVFLVLLAGIFDGALWAAQSWGVANAARQGARYGIYLPASAADAATMDSNVQTAARAAAAKLFMDPARVTVTVCRHASPNAATTAACDTAGLAHGSVGDVTVTYPLSFFFSLTGTVLGQDSRTITGYQRVRIE